MQYTSRLAILLGHLTIVDMKIDKENLKGSQIKIKIELTDEEMKTYKSKATQALQKEVKVPGFREGKVPMNVLEEHMGTQSFIGVVLELALEESYSQAVLQEKLRPADYPKLNIVQQDPLIYEAEIQLIPVVDFKKDPSTLTVKRKEVKVEEEEVKEVLENFVKRTVEWKTVEREAKMGDRVEIDFDGKDKDGVPLEGTSSKNHPVVLGSKSLIPGFEEEVVGMKKDEEKEFEIIFPKDYHKESFQNKKVTFKIKLQMVEEGKESEINDAFAQKVSGDEKKTLDTLKNEIKGELKKQKESLEDRRVEGDFLEELIKLVDTELPQVLIEKEIDFLIERITEDLKKQKKTWGDYEKEVKAEGKEPRKELEKPAKEQVLLRLALERLFEIENPEISEEDIEEEIEALTGHYPPEIKPMLKQRYQHGSKEREVLHSQAKLKKVVKSHTKS